MLQNLTGTLLGFRRFNQATAREVVKSRLQKARGQYFHITSAWARAVAEKEIRACISQGCDDCIPPITRAA